jgi:transposase
LGRSRGGLSTKIHVRVDGKGQIITFLLTPGQQHEISVAEQLMEQGAIHQKVGRPRIRPKRIVGDKGYTSTNFRTYLRRRGIQSTIAHRSNEKRRGYFNKDLYRHRNKVERLIGRVKEFRRIATRYEKRALNYAAMLTIAAIFLWSQGFAYTP